MELNFDKEIDALIRREAAGRTITISERAGLHLDADEIAAFSEGSVPAAARQTFVRHFVECDSCRKVLSSAIALRPEDVEEAAPGVAAPAVVQALPWYRRLFMFPNLAYVMGGLVLLFAGFIGVSVLTTTYYSGQSEMSKAPAPEERAPMAPLANSNSSMNAANASSSSANTAANVPYADTETVPSADSPSNTSVAQEVPFTAPADEGKRLRDMQPLATPAPPPPPARSGNFAVDGVASGRVQESRPAAAPPDPAVDKKIEQSKSVPENAPLVRGPMPKSKGPTRNDRNERNMALEGDRARQTVPRKADSAGSSADLSASGGSKSVRGRTFVFRQGAWYDTTYQGQGTINVRRNTNDYKKLDGGLRSIAEGFIGTVVVTIWNGRAYRIQ